MRRRHRLYLKLALIDECIAFVSGVNIVNDLPGGQILAPRLNCTVEIQAATTEQIYFVMRRCGR
ncbi:hypothetical protein NTGM5_850004 [Candidatus Nitrotoga sp. M5]|nr:hypothetical protein NTGM5_850004 [Candidatus Nitrotoga sp. M5]